MTPVRRQFLRIKQRYPDALLLFRMGDFYETFDEDARVASRELDIVLTSRSMGKGTVVPLAGIPAHSLEPYLARLIKQGHKVAICEQLSDPAASKGLVERDVVRVVTPGTVLEPSLLDQKANNYLAAVALGGDEAGVSYVDITTGEFCATQLPLAQLALELGRLAPAEVLAEDGHEEGWSVEYTVTPLPARIFQLENARRTLLDHFGVVSLEPFGCESLPLAARAAGAIVDYLSQTQRDSLGELTSLNTYSTASYMTLDRQTRRNLELFEGGRWGTGGPSLYSTLDLTRTPMGGRLLRRWLGQPLRDLQELVRRQGRRGVLPRRACGPGAGLGNASAHCRPGARLQPDSPGSSPSPGAAGPEERPGSGPGADGAHTGAGGPGVAPYRRGQGTRPLPGGHRAGSIFAESRSNGRAR